jgi:predicted nucleic acid-binding protein
MSGDNIVADTSILVNFFNGIEVAERFLEERTIFVSVITEIELLCYPKLSNGERKLIKEFLSECIIIDLEPEIKDLIIEIRTKHKIKLPDAAIAATAMKYDLPLFTMDKGFNKIIGLKPVIIEI